MKKITRINYGHSVGGDENMIYFYHINSVICGYNRDNGELSIFSHFYDNIRYEVVEYLNNLNLKIISTYGYNYEKMIQYLEELNYEKNN